MYINLFPIQLYHGECDSIIKSHINMPGIRYSPQPQVVLSCSANTLQERFLI